MPCYNNHIDKSKVNWISDFIRCYDTNVYIIFCPPKIRKDTRLPFAIMCGSLGTTVPHGGASALNIKHLNYIDIWNESISTVVVAHCYAIANEMH